MRARSPGQKNPGWPAVPATLWLLLFLGVPLLAIVGMSFLTRGESGEILWQFTLTNYSRLAGFGELGFDPLYPRILLRTLGLGVATTAICLALGLPTAFFIDSLAPRLKNITLILVVIPFWTSLIIRTYAWQLLLGASGPIPIFRSLYPGTAAVLIGLTCDYLPFFILPACAVIEKVDWHLAEAASDLGANRWNCFRHAILPQIRPGIVVASLFVFLPVLGQFVIPDLLGGAKTALLGNIIQQQFGQSRDWPFGSAIAALTLFFLLPVFFRRRKSSEVEAHIVAL